MRAFRLVPLSAVLAFASCAASPHGGARYVDLRAGEAAILETDAAWAKAAGTKQVDAWMAYYTADAVVLPPNEATLTDPAGVRSLLSGLLALPNLTMGWKTTRAVIAASGDLGYSYGVYQLSFTGPDGKPVQDHGKVLQIWRLDAEGKWKCAVDTWSSDLPAPK